MPIGPLSRGISRFMINRETFEEFPMGTMCVEVAHSFFPGSRRVLIRRGKHRSGNAAIAWAFLACSSAQMVRTRPLASLQGTGRTGAEVGELGRAVSVERLEPLFSLSFPSSASPRSVPTAI
jgi:hypothetical protein